MRVEVAYALPNNQRIVTVEVPEGCTVYDAAVASGIANIFPDIDLESVPMGVFGKAVPKPKEEVLKENHRVEIYRPLIADPKASRAKRAEKAKKKAQD